MPPRHAPQSGAAGGCQASGGGEGRGASRSLAGPLRDGARTMVTAMVVMVLAMVDGVGDDGRVGDGNDAGNCVDMVITLSER